MQISIGRDLSTGRERHRPRKRDLRLPNAMVNYDRMRDLPGLLRLWPGEISALCAETPERLVEFLERAIAAERRRGKAGRWSYDLNRHIALARALRHEQALLGDNQGAPDSDLIT